jgi:hypothetical protein
MKEYKVKLHEYYTPETIRVYCANAQCAKYHHPRTLDDSDQRRTVVVCECGTTTCVGCKSEWEDGHACVPIDPSRRPVWVPEYTAECRIKQCPKCREWIQLSEACNHLNCSSCGHGFCFVCLLEWTGQHAGCSQYGDPVEGYDDEGFELTKRGLHIYTGRDRHGFDRCGINVVGDERSESVEDAGIPNADRLEELVAAFRLPPAIDEEGVNYALVRLMGAIERLESLRFGGDRLDDEIVTANPPEIPEERIPFWGTDFGLGSLFAEEDCGPSITLQVLAASGLCQFEFPVHRNSFELLMGTAEDSEYGDYPADDSEKWLVMFCEMNH